MIEEKSDVARRKSEVKREVKAQVQSHDRSRRTKSEAINKPKEDAMVEG